MRILQILSAIVGFHSLCAQQQPALLSDPPDGSESKAPEIRYVFPPAEVLETTVHEEGGRKIIVQNLALDPTDPVKPVRHPEAAPAAPQPPGEPFFTPPTFLTMLSATVYPGPRTNLRWTHVAEDGETREYSGWSNIDFNHISGITTFRATDGEEHSFVMGIGTGQSPAENAPEFPTSSPTFIPDQENVPDDALILVDSLHKLYAVEGSKLAAAAEGRERAEEAHAAELLAHPPQPKDLIIRYRIAETPLDETEVQTPETR